MNLLEQFNMNRHKYTKNEEVLYDLIFENIDRVINHNITVFSTQIGTSTASLSRFIKKNGFESYNQFRLECLKFKNSALEEEDDNQSRDYVENYIDKCSDFLSVIRETIKTEDVEEICNLLIKYDRICIYGSYRSRLIAEKIMMELLPVGKYVELVSSEMMTNNIDILSQHYDCVIFISESLKSSTVNHILSNYKDIPMHKAFITMRMHEVVEDENVTFIKLPNTSDYPLYSFLDNSLIYALFINMFINSYSKKVNK